mgnify:CR=1 FL=1
MAGYVGERARRKKRNIILTFIFIIVGLIVFFIIPKLQLDENIPSQTLLPSEQEIVSPELKADYVELELQVFQKEQKIIFRDQQISKLKKNIEILTVENKKLSETINKQLTDTINQNVEFENSKEKINKIQSEAQQQINKLNQKIETIKKDSEILKKSQKENISENQLLKNEQKNFFNKNMKLANENKKLADENKKFEIQIQSLEQQIKEQNALIKKLEDISHH